MKVIVLNPVWSKADDGLTLRKILKYEKKSYGSVTYYKAACSSPDPEIKEAVRKNFRDDYHGCDLYTRELEAKYPQERFIVKSWRKKEEKSFFPDLVFKGKRFYTGSLQRVIEGCKLMGIPCDVEYAGNWTALAKKEAIAPSVPEITFRKDQVELITAAMDTMRGQIDSPTGSGKTVVAAALFSAFPNRKRLFLCHTTSLLNQTYDAFKDEYHFDVSMVGDKHADLSGSIVVSTVQSFVKYIDDEAICKKFDMFVVDEVHHVREKDCQFAQVLERLICCSVRFGVSATVLTPEMSPVGVLVVEGLIGPVVSEYSLQDGIDEGVLVKPRVRIVKLPKVRVSDSSYKTANKEAVVENRIGNRVIMETIKDDYISENKSVLIFVNAIKHGENLMDMAQMLGMKVCFVQGKTETEDREEIKALFNEKKELCVISTSVWREGVNIPSLNVVALAGGGESVLMVKQEVGRGYRTSEGKNEIIFLDFFNPSSPHLIKHFGTRISTYCDMGAWSNK